MALPVPIYFYPPYIAVLPVASVYNVDPGKGLQFGYVQQLSNSPMNYAVEGDRVLYRQDENELGQVITISEVQYQLIDESKIILIEPNYPVV